MSTIAIISRKGGAGKTTLAVHLAAAAERAERASLIIDLDPQGTACQWGEWRNHEPPEVIETIAPRLASKIEQANARGADLIVIDTPPHADSAATAAVEAADLVLIPCRPSGFDLAAVKATLRLAQLDRTPAYVLFMGGPPNAPKLIAEAGEQIEKMGGRVCPIVIPDRAAFRYATSLGQTVFDSEPHGKGAEEVMRLYEWTCEHVNMSTERNAA